MVTPWYGLVESFIEDIGEQWYIGKSQTQRERSRLNTASKTGICARDGRIAGV